MTMNEHGFLLHLRIQRSNRLEQRLADPWSLVHGIHIPHMHRWSPHKLGFSDFWKIDEMSRAVNDALLDPTVADNPQRGLVSIKTKSFGGIGCVISMCIVSQLQIESDGARSHGTHASMTKCICYAAVRNDAPLAYMSKPRHVCLTAHWTGALRSWLICHGFLSVSFGPHPYMACLSQGLISCSSAL